MKYPSCYVLLVDERPNLIDLPRQNTLAQEGLLGTGMPDDGLLGDSSHKSRVLEPVSEMTTKTNKLLCSKMVEKVSQDSCVTAGLSKR